MRVVVRQDVVRVVVRQDVVRQDVVRVVVRQDIVRVVVCVDEASCSKISYLVRTVSVFPCKNVCNRNKLL